MKNSKFNDFQIAGPLEFEKMARAYSESLKRQNTIQSELTINPNTILSESYTEEITYLLNYLVRLYEYIKENRRSAKEKLSFLETETATRTDLNYFLENSKQELQEHREMGKLPTSFSTAIKLAIHTETELIEYLNSLNDLSYSSYVSSIIFSRLKVIRSLLLLF